MRKPAQIESWLTPEEWLSWLKEAPSVEAYQKRLAVWLTCLGPLHAQEIAKMLGVSKQAVWLWLGQYNKHGPVGLDRKGRGGRRWSLISWEEEETLLKSLENRALDTCLAPSNCSPNCPRRWGMRFPWDMFMAY